MLQGIIFREQTGFFFFLFLVFFFYLTLMLHA